MRLWPWPSKSKISVLLYPQLHHQPKFGEIPSTDSRVIMLTGRMPRHTDGCTHGQTTWKHNAAIGDGWRHNKLWCEAQQTPPPAAASEWYWLNFRDPHFRIFWGLGLLLGYIATSNAKSDVRFLLGDPDFLLGRRNFAPILLSYRDPHFGLFEGLGWGI